MRCLYKTKEGSIDDSSFRRGFEYLEHSNALQKLLRNYNNIIYFARKRMSHSQCKLGGLILTPHQLNMEVATLCYNLYSIHRKPVCSLKLKQKQLARDINGRGYRITVLLLQ
jgi:hypothetical protein